MSDLKIYTAIQDYLKARKKLIQIGQSFPKRIGGNDNMIGRIGEFYAIRFLEDRGQSPTMVTSRSNQGFDLVDDSDVNLTTQVKLITSENSTGRTVRLKTPWAQFVLIELGNDYQPSRIGLVTMKNFERSCAENPKWSNSPYVKRSMLGSKGLFGRYGEVFDTFILTV